MIESVKTESEKQIKDLFARVVAKRMKIRNIGEDMLFETPSKDSKERYVAYFLEASALAPPAPQSKIGGARFTDQAFDIRNGIRFSLLDPDAVLPQEKEFLP